MSENYRYRTNEEIAWRNYLNLKRVMKEKEFVWTDELVYELSRRFTKAVDLKSFINEFKSEHSPKKEVEYPKGIASFRQVNDIKTIMEIEYKSTDESRYQKFVRRNLELGNHIHSVLNSSDETLTVGDCVTVGKYNDGHNLLSFDIYEHGIRANIANCDVYHIDEVHPKQVMKTEDGYDVKEGDNIYIILDSNLNLGTRIFNKKLPLKHCYLKKENAIKYVKF